MKVNLISTGPVAIALAHGFADRGHEVVFGTRDVNGERALAAARAVPKSRVLPHADAAAWADIAVVATPWDATEAALGMAGAANLAGKLVIDVTNPLDASSGKPKLALGFPDSAGARVQAWLPGAKVVKAFNIITATRMVAPVFADGQADMFIAGNDVAAKAQVAEILRSFGWRSAIDMGVIEQSYLLEAIAMTWIDYGIARNHWSHGFSLLGGHA